MFIDEVLFYLNESLKLSFKQILYLLKSKYLKNYTVEKLHLYFTGSRR